MGLLKAWSSPMPFDKNTRTLYSCMIHCYLNICKRLSLKDNCTPCNAYWVVYCPLPSRVSCCCARPLAPVYDEQSFADKLADKANVASRLKQVWPVWLVSRILQIQISYLVPFSVLTLGTRGSGWRLTNINHWNWNDLNNINKDLSVAKADLPI